MFQANKGCIVVWLKHEVDERDRQYGALVIKGGGNVDKLGNDDFCLAGKVWKEASTHGWMYEGEIEVGSIDLTFLRLVHISIRAPSYAPSKFVVGEVNMQQNCKNKTCVRYARI